MQSKILQIIYGNQEQGVAVVNESYENARAELVNVDDEMIKILKNSPKTLKLYQKVQECLSVLNCEEVEAYYVEGVRDGFLLCMEVFKVGVYQSESKMK